MRVPGWPIALVVVCTLGLAQRRAWADDKPKCEGEVEAPGPDQAQFHVRWSFDTLMGEPTRLLTIMWTLSDYIVVDDEQVRLQDISPEERAGLELTSLDGELRIYGAGAYNIDCTVKLWKGDMGTFEKEGVWGFDVSASPSWDTFFDDCDAWAAKQLLKGGCGYAMLHVNSYTLFDMSLRERLAHDKAAVAAAGRGKKAYDEHRLADAIKEYGDALANDPDNADALFWIERVRADVAQVQSLIDQGNGDLAAGDLSGAQSAFEEAQRLDAGNADAARGLQAIEQAIEREHEQMKLRVEEAKARLEAGEPLPYTPLTPYEQMVQADADMHAASEALGSALASAPPGALMWLGIFLGPPAIVYGASYLADSIATDGFSATQVEMHMGIYLGPSLFAGLLQRVANKPTRDRWTERGRGWLADARQRCAAGSLAHCEAGVTLAQQLVDLDRTAPHRSDASLWWGPGSLAGPRWAFYSLAGVSTGAVHDPQLGGALTGASTQIRMRTSVVRLGVGFESLFGDIDPTGEIDGAWSAFGTVGLQVGAGLLAPYGELRIGGVSESGAEKSADPWHVSPALSKNFELQLAVGNTVHLQSLFSSRGPSYVSLFVDVARTIGLVGPLTGGWELTAGFASYVVSKPHYGGASIGQPRAARAPRPHPRSYMEPALIYGFADGVGLELVRCNGLRSHGALVLSSLDVSVHLDSGGFTGVGLTLLPVGYRKRFGASGWEAGFRVGVLGADVTDMETGVDGTERATTGLFPTSVYARKAFRHVAVEAGFHTPLLWYRDRPAGGNELYPGFPGYAYLGIGFGALDSSGASR